MKYIKDVPMVTTNHRNPIPKTRKSVLFSKKRRVEQRVLGHYDTFQLF